MAGGWTPNWPRMAIQLHACSDGNYSPVGSAATVLFFPAALAFFNNPSALLISSSSVLPCKGYSTTPTETVTGNSQAVEVSWMAARTRSAHAHCLFDLCLRQQQDEFIAKAPAADEITPDESLPTAPSQFDRSVCHRRHS